MTDISRAAENPFAQHKKIEINLDREYAKLVVPYYLADQRLTDAQRQDVERIRKKYIAATSSKYHMLDDQVMAKACDGLQGSGSGFQDKFKTVFEHDDKLKIQAQNAVLDAELPQVDYINRDVLRAHLKSTEVLLTQAMTKIAMAQQQKKPPTVESCRILDTQFSRYIQKNGL